MPYLRSVTHALICLFNFFLLPEAWCVGFDSVFVSFCPDFSCVFLPSMLFCDSKIGNRSKE